MHIIFISNKFNEIILSYIWYRDMTKIIQMESYDLICKKKMFELTNKIDIKVDTDFWN